MNPNVLEVLSATPLVALGLAVGGLVLVALVVRALRRRGPKAPAATMATTTATATATHRAAASVPRTPDREDRAPRVPETAAGDAAGAPTRATMPPSPVDRPVSVTAPDVEPPPVERTSDIVARGDPPAAPRELVQAPSVEAPSAAELPPLPLDDAPVPLAGRNAPQWFDAIPTPEVVEVEAPDTEPAIELTIEPEIEPEAEIRAAHEDVVAPSFDAEPLATPRLADEALAKATGDAPAADVLPAFEPSVDDTPAATAADEPLLAFTLDEPVVDNVGAPPAAEPAPAAELTRHEIEPAAPQDDVAPPSVAAAPPVDREPAPVVAPPPAAPPPPADAGPARLLVVDDSAVVRAKLRKVLEGGGHKVDVAKDGREALALLAAGRYTLMVTDLEMPTMSGFELIAAVQTSAGLAALPIVAITGHDDLEPYRQRLPGLAGLFRKPWVDGDLLAHLAGVLAHAASAAGPAASPPSSPPSSPLSAPSPEAVAAG